MARIEGSKTKAEVCMSLQEVGNILGVSAACVFDTERRALRKIRELLLTKYGGSITLDDILFVKQT